MRKTHLVIAHGVLCACAPRDQMKVGENRGFAKGGIGIVHVGLYIVLTSSRNELLLGQGKQWTGDEAGRREVVFVVDQTVIAGAAVPPGFKMAEASVISFEGDKVVFMDFKSGMGGYYERRLNHAGGL